MAWQSRYIGRGEPFGEWRTIEWPVEECANLTRGAVAHMRAPTDVEVRPLYTHPPRDERRPASEECSPGLNGCVRHGESAGRAVGRRAGSLAPMGSSATDQS